MAILDDEPVIVNLLEQVVFPLGFETSTAGSCAEMMRMLGEMTELDVAILDKNLPDGSGLDVARELRRRFPDAAIMILTGYSSVESSIAAIDIGDVDYMQKPIDDLDAFCTKLSAMREKALLRRRVRLNEERYRRAFVSAYDALVVFDAKSRRIVELNPAGRALFGLAAKDAERGIIVDDLIRIGELPGEQLIRQKHGSERWCEGHASDMALESGDAVLLTLRDVTECRRAEEERERFERQIRDARTMEAVGRLSSGIAHDFNNLLSVMLGNAEFVQQTSTDELIRTTAEDICSAGRVASSLIQRMLAFARGAGERSGRCDVTAVVDRMVPILRVALGPKFRLSVGTTQAVGAAAVDTDELSQLLMNLVLNARDAMSAGGTVQVQFARTSVLEVEASVLGVEAGDFVNIVVEDNGSGMTPEVRDRIFEPYFTTKAKGKGTGLGLATVYGIVKQRGGAINVRSTPNVGTTFELWLPVARRAAEGTTQRSVLIVDDEPGILRFVTRILESRGYHVQQASDGNEAIAILNKGAMPSLVLTDIRMNNGDGYSVAREVLATRPDTPIVFMTGFSEGPPTDLADALSGAATLHKPFTASDVLGVVGEKLGAVS